MEKDRTRLIEGPGSVDENDPDQDKEPSEEPYKANIRKRNPKKHRMDENDEEDGNDSHGPQRKRRRITRSSK